MSEEMGGEVSASSNTSEVAANSTATAVETSAHETQQANLNGAASESTKTSPQAATTDAGTQAAVAAAFQPNFKFKFLDADGKTRKELEFDEWAKSAIKDPDTEKKIRELYEKAYGLDYTKGSRDKFRSEAETLRTEITDQKKAINILSNYLQGDDMQSFFEALRIPEDKVLKYALNRLQYRDLPQDKRAEYDQMRDATKRAAILEDQNRTLYEQFQQTQVETRSRDLETQMSDPSVAQVSRMFDERMGSGAFRNEVIRRGQYYWAVHKKDVPVQQAVQEVLQMIGGMPQAPQSTASLQQFQVATPGATTAGSQTPEAKPVIPNIQGRGTSPARKVPRSVADLKKLAAAGE